VGFLHENGYTHHGDAPISGLLPIELDTLRLSHLVEREQAESDDAADDPAGLRERKRENRAGHQRQREKLFGDLDGFQ